MLIPIVVVRLAGAESDVARDVAAANEIWSTHCGVWFELDANVVVDRPDLLILDQTDCLAEGHVVSQEEDELYDLGRGRGTDLVAYYIDGATVARSDVPRTRQIDADSGSLRAPSTSCSRTRPATSSVTIPTCRTPTT